MRSRYIPLLLVAASAAAPGRRGTLNLRRRRLLGAHRCAKGERFMEELGICVVGLDANWGDESNQQRVAADTLVLGRFRLYVLGLALPKQLAACQRLAMQKSQDGLANAS